MAQLLRVAVALGLTAAIAFGCGKTSDDTDATPASGATGAPGGAVNGGGVNGGASRGGASRGGASGTDGGPIQLPNNPLPDGCEPTPQASAWGSGSGEHICYEVADFSKPHTIRSRVPSFFDSVGGAAGVGGASGVGGAAGAGSAGPVELDTCPAASELDWSCSPSESLCCPIPQCEAPDDSLVIDGKCCYFVYRSCGA